MESYTVICSCIFKTFIYSNFYQTMFTSVLCDVAPVQPRPLPSCFSIFATCTRVATVTTPSNSASAPSTSTTLATVTTPSYSAFAPASNTPGLLDAAKLQALVSGGSAVGRTPLDYKRLNATVKDKNRKRTRITSKTSPQDMHCETPDPKRRRAPKGSATKKIEGSATKSDDLAELEKEFDKLPELLVHTRIRSPRPNPNPMSST